MATVASVVLAAATGLMQLQSGDIGGGAPVPRALMATGCGGANRSPALTWSGAPGAVKSFAAIMHDPDAPMPGGFYHWVVYNLPADTRTLAADARLTEQQLGLTTRGTPGYTGPCPPPGPAHHYILTLYALDLSQIAADGPLTGPQVEQLIEGHVLAHAVVEGTAAR